MSFRKNIRRRKELYNVLIGEMSLIGPRPLVPEELEAHEGDKMYYIMRPGITGWWYILDYY